GVGDRSWPADTGSLPGEDRMEGEGGKLLGFAGPVHGDPVPGGAAGGLFPRSCLRGWSGVEVPVLVWLVGSRGPSDPPWGPQKRPQMAPSGGVDTPGGYIRPGGKYGPGSPP